jgi:hypothetical protein
VTSLKSLLYVSVEEESIVNGEDMKRSLFSGWGGGGGDNTIGFRKLLFRHIR